MRIPMKFMLATNQGGPPPLLSSLHLHFVQVFVSFVVFALLFLFLSSYSSSYNVCKNLLSNPPLLHVQAYPDKSTFPKKEWIRKIMKRQIRGGAHNNHVTNASSSPTTTTPFLDKTVLEAKLSNIEEALNPLSDPDSDYEDTVDRIQPIQSSFSWNMLTGAFRMNLDAKDELFTSNTSSWSSLSSSSSSLSSSTSTTSFRSSSTGTTRSQRNRENASSILTSSGGGVGLKVKSSTTSLITSKTTERFERVGKKIWYELTKEEGSILSQRSNNIQTTNRVHTSMYNNQTYHDHNQEVSLPNEKVLLQQHDSTTTKTDQNPWLPMGWDSNKQAIQPNKQKQVVTSTDDSYPEQMTANESDQVVYNNQNIHMTASTGIDGQNLWEETTKPLLSYHNNTRKNLTSVVSTKTIRIVRKKVAHLTGLHGFFSGKGRRRSRHYDSKNFQSQELNEEDLGIIRRRITAIQRARERVADKIEKDGEYYERKTFLTRSNLTTQEEYIGVRPWGKALVGIFRRLPLSKSNTTDEENNITMGNKRNHSDEVTTENFKRTLTWTEDLERIAMVQEIDRLIQEGQQRIIQLQCQKDSLQQRPNPLFNYTMIKSEITKGDTVPINSSTVPRIFNFPSRNIVDEYIDDLVDTGRLLKLNHTHLWRYESDDEDDIGDDLLTPSADAKRLYENGPHTLRPSGKGNLQATFDRRDGNGNVGGGSWLLRQSIGKGGSIGEKLGETIETAAYKCLCSGIMSALSRIISQLHGVNIMRHSDIRLFMENAPDLPPMARQPFEPEDYAQEALRRVIRKSSKKKRKRKGYRNENHDFASEDSFLQKNAIVETLLSDCQISAPLLKLFPLAWQRAMLGNCVTLTTAIVSDFCNGIQFQIIGHSLSLSFEPLTEEDILRHLDTKSVRSNHRLVKPDEFEAAVRDTAADICESLRFLDKWHERALGGDVLKAQLGNLIARLVLTLVDEVLSSARIDLWTSQAGGPRMLLGLEYRSKIF